MLITSLYQTVLGMLSTSQDYVNSSNTAVSAVKVATLPVHWPSLWLMYLFPGPGQPSVAHVSVPRTWPTVCNCLTPIERPLRDLLQRSPQFPFPQH